MGGFPIIKVWFVDEFHSTFEGSDLEDLDRTHGPYRTEEEALSVVDEIKKQNTGAHQITTREELAEVLPDGRLIVGDRVEQFFPFPENGS